jgi:gliding motility-associated-like protein
MGVNFQCADDSTSQVLNLLPTPPVTFLTGVTSSQEILYGTSIQLNAAGGVLYHWVPDDGSLSNNNINNPIATPRDSTRYIVYSYNEHGCLDTAYVDITVRHSDNDGYPTGFTPNGDGQNDEFRIPPGRVDRLVQFTIYNRWGEIVFQTNDKNKGWDGHHNGAPQDMGVYFYEIIVAHSDGANKMLKGSVTLIR